MIQKVILLPLATALILAAWTTGLRADEEGPSQEFIEQYRKAGQLFSENELDAALEALDEADAIDAGVPDSRNLRGAILVRQERYDDAREAFLEALELDPELFPAKFNLAEIKFVTENYPEARAEFEAILGESPNPRMTEFVRYKIFLCLLMEDRARAESYLDQHMTPFGDTPAYQFSQAALAFHEDDEALAVDWLGSAFRIFPPQQNNLFLDSLVELGWLNRGDAVTEELEEVIPE